MPPVQEGGFKKEKGKRKAVRYGFLVGGSTSIVEKGKNPRKKKISKKGEGTRLITFWKQKVGL